MENNKLIYSGALEKQFEKLVRSWSGTFSGPAYLDALERLRNAPKVDAVPVVRCKDCSKAIIDHSGRENHLCMKNKSFPQKVKLDSFCSDGEMRFEAERDAVACGKGESI